VIRPCPVFVPSTAGTGTCAPDCPSSSNPFANLSAEGPDGLDYLATSYASCNPALGQNWSSTYCSVTYASIISAVDAALNAAVEAQCDPSATIYNEAQTGTALCPNGTVSTYTVAEGLFTGINQSAANEIALNLANKIAKENIFCPTVDPAEGCLCIFSSYSATFHSVDPATTWTLSDAPPGVTLTGTGLTVTVSGTVTEPGVYVMVVEATSASGVTQTTLVPLSVLEVTTAGLPTYSVGVPYSYQLTAAGGSGIYNWKIAGGALPNGLTLSLTGLISGVPV
jgi:hypothetical protein